MTLTELRRLRDLERQGDKAAAEEYKLAVFQYIEELLVESDAPADETAALTTPEALERMREQAAHLLEHEIPIGIVIPQTILALITVLTAARERVEELEQQLAESDAAIYWGREDGALFDDATGEHFENEAIARHRARQEGGEK